MYHSLSQEAMTGQEHVQKASKIAEEYLADIINQGYEVEPKAFKALENMREGDFGLYTQRRFEVHKESGNMLEYFWVHFEYRVTHMGYLAQIGIDCKPHEICENPFAV